MLRDGRRLALHSHNQPLFRSLCQTRLGTCTTTASKHRGGDYELAYFFSSKQAFGPDLAMGQT